MNNAINLWGDIKCFYIYVHLSVAQTSLACGPLLSWKITTDDHMYIECLEDTRVGNLIVATIYLQLIQNRYMFRSFTLLQCSHQHCVQPAASDVEVVGCL